MLFNIADDKMERMFELKMRDTKLFFLEDWKGTKETEAREKECA